MKNTVKYLPKSDPTGSIDSSDSIDTKASKSSSNSARLRKLERGFDSAEINDPMNVLGGKFYKSKKKARKPKKNS